MDISGMTVGSTSALTNKTLTLNWNLIKVRS